MEGDGSVRRSSGAASRDFDTAIGMVKAGLVAGVVDDDAGGHEKRAEGRIDTHEYRHVERIGVAFSSAVSLWFIPKQARCLLIVIDQRSLRPERRRRLVASADARQCAFRSSRICFSCIVCSMCGVGCIITGQPGLRSSRHS